MRVVLQSGLNVREATAAMTSIQVAFGKYMVTQPWNAVTGVICLTFANADVRPEQVAALDCVIDAGDDPVGAEATPGMSVSAVIGGDVASVARWY
jgi:hypothetical protein